MKTITEKESCRIKIPCADSITATAHGDEGWAACTDLQVIRGAANAGEAPRTLRAASVGENRAAAVTPTALAGQLRFQLGTELRK